MGQDEGMYHQFVPLALHLAEDFFLQHPSRDVQLLIACCIADVLRVYAPEAPYKDPEQVKVMKKKFALAFLQNFISLFINAEMLQFVFRQYSSS